MNPSPTIKSFPTTIIGFNHIGITVKDLDKMLDFYQKATNFQVLKRVSISENEATDKLFAQKGIGYEQAILKGSNMLLELTEFAGQTDTIISEMPPQGSRMTHTCYQSLITNAGYDKFVKAGVDMLSRGKEAIDDLGGYGVTYAYATKDGKELWAFGIKRDYEAINSVKAFGGAIDSDSPIVVGSQLFINSGYAKFKEKEGNVLLAFKVKE